MPLQNTIGSADVDGAPRPSSRLVEAPRAYLKSRHCFEAWDAQMLLIADPDTPEDARIVGELKSLVVMGSRMLWTRGR